MVNIDQINFENKRVVIRVDFNVPLDDNFNITDDTRMRAALPTINKVLNDKGMVVLMSHLGRPKKNPDPKYSIKPIIKHLEELLGRPVQFATDCMKAADQVAALKPCEVLVLENLRFYAEEEGKPRGVEKGEEGYDEATQHLTPTKSLMSMKPRSLLTRSQLTTTSFRVRTRQQAKHFPFLFRTPTDRGTRDVTSLSLPTQEAV